MKHYYLIAFCKTPGCATGVNLAYVGTQKPEGLKLWLPKPFFIDNCGRCGKSHEYEMADIRTMVAKHGPPKGWIDQIRWER